MSLRRSSTRWSRQGAPLGGPRKMTVRQHMALARNQVNIELDGIAVAVQKIEWLVQQLRLIYEQNTSVDAGADVPLDDDLKTNMTNPFTALQAMQQSSTPPEDTNVFRVLGLLNAGTRMVAGNSGVGDAPLRSLAEAVLQHINTSRYGDIRAAGFRLCRYIVVCVDLTGMLLRRNIDISIVRALERDVPATDSERLQAAQMLRVFVKKNPRRMPVSIVSLLVALAKSSDIFKSVAVENLYELVLTNTEQVAQLGGIPIIMSSILESESRKQIELMVLAVVSLCDSENTRQHFDPSRELPKLLAPLISGAYTHKDKDMDDAYGSNNYKNSTYIASSYVATITLLRTWPGLITLCRSKIGLPSIVDALRLPVSSASTLRVNFILSLIFEVLEIPLPGWKDDIISALRSKPHVDEDDFGGNTIPRVSSVQLNLVEPIVALLADSFVKAGLTEVLSHLIISCSEKFITTRATILLCSVLDVASKVLPDQPLAFRVKSYLVDRANLNPTENNLAKSREEDYYRIRSQARVALINLEKCEQHAAATERMGDPLRISFDDTAFVTALKECRVLDSRDRSTWDWALVLALSGQSEEWDKKRFDSATVGKFVKRILGVFKPNAKPMPSFKPIVTKAFRQLVRTLVRNEDGVKLIQSTDIVSELKIALESVHIDPNTELFSSEGLACHVPQTCFALLGVLTSSSAGMQLLMNSETLKQMYRIGEAFNRPDIVSLLIDCLNPRLDGHPKVLFQMLATSPLPKARYLATQRAFDLAKKVKPVQLRRDPFLLEILVNQLTDPEASISHLALAAVASLCDDGDILRAVVDLRPAVLHLSKGGYDLAIRFTGCQRGIAMLDQAGFIIPEIDMWIKSGVWNYTRRVEKRLVDAFGLLEEPSGRENDLSCVITSPTMEYKSKGREVRLPPHLYGELCKTPMGIELLMKSGHIPRLVELIENAVAATPVAFEDILRAKSALWAFAHIGTSGSTLLSDSLYASVVALAKTATCMSLRGTAVFALNLLAQNSRGENVLQNFGWETKLSSLKSVTFCTPSIADSLFMVPTCALKLKQVETKGNIPKAPQGKSYQQFVEDLVGEAITSGGNRGRTGQSNVEAFERAVLCCVAAMSNDISGGKVKTLLHDLKEAGQSELDTLPMYCAIRSTLDGQIVDLSKRRLIDKIFKNRSFFSGLADFRDSRQRQWSISSDTIPMDRPEHSEKLARLRPRRPGAPPTQYQHGENEWSCDKLWQLYDDTDKYLSELFEDVAAAHDLAKLELNLSSTSTA